MKKIQGILAMMIIGVLAAGITGCSNILTTGDTLDVGDNNDVNYQFVEQEIFSDEIYEGIDVSLDLTESLIDSIPGASPTRPHIVAEAAGSPVLNSLSYTYSNNWHIFTFTGYISEMGSADTVDFTGIDSIQVFDNGQIQQIPDDSSDAFNFRAHFTATGRNNSDSLVADHAVQVALDNVNADLIHLDAQLDEAIWFEYSNSTDTCQVNVTSSFTADDITMLESQGDASCPQSGMITIAVSVMMTCAGGGANPFSLSIDGSWTAVGTFDGSSESFTISDGTNEWTSTEPCGVQPARGITGCFVGR